MEVDMMSDLARDLLAMAQADRNMRSGLMDGKPWDTSVDERSTKRMHEIVDRYGWPKVSDVGEEAASAAWVLVQHADLDPDFQVHCLALIHDLPEDEISPSDQAYLEDRVRVNTGRPQLYGTQFTDETGVFEPQPIEDPAGLDERRAAVGLGPFAEYEASMHELNDKDKERRNS